MLCPLSLNNFINKSSNRIGFPTSPRSLFRSNLFCLAFRKDKVSCIYVFNLEAPGAGQCPAGKPPLHLQANRAGMRENSSGTQVKRRMQPGVIYMGTSNGTAPLASHQQSWTARQGPSCAENTLPSPSAPPNPPFSGLSSHTFWALWMAFHLPSTLMKCMCVTAVRVLCTQCWG